jgi:radical SAM protein with 4Fe4S-binding SPASM domain
MLFWESTARCNLACDHCRRLDVHASPEELTTAQAKGLLESAAKMGPPVLVFSGGEPLLRDDWQELAHYAADLDLPTALASNGTLIDSAMARQISRANFSRVAVSIDAAGAQAHDAIRGAGAFAKTRAGLGELACLSVPTQINVTVTRANFAQLDEILALAINLGVRAIHLFMLVPVGCGLEIAPSQQLSPRQYEQVLNWICDRQAEQQTLNPAIELRSTCGPAYYRVAAERGMKLSRPGQRGCLAGISVLFVSHKGDVFPCGYLPISCGSLRGEPLERIWQRSPVLAELRDFDKLKGKCSRCEFKIICGGCRARALAATGDYLGEEPHCPHEPK